MLHISAIYVASYYNMNGLNIVGEMIELPEEYIYLIRTIKIRR